MTGMDFDINYGASEEGFIHVITDYPNLTGIQHDCMGEYQRWHIKKLTYN